MWGYRTLNYDQIKEYSPCEPYDVLFCFRFSKVLRSNIIKIPKIAAINFHGSLLPKYAGLGSIFQSMFHKEEMMGGSFHLIDEEIDTGNIITQSKFNINSKKSVSFHHIKCYVESSKLFSDIFERILVNKYKLQNKKEILYFSFPDKNKVRSFKGSFIKFQDIVSFFKFLLKGSYE